MRLTLAQIKASRIPKVLGLCSTDSRVVDYVNAAQDRLLHMGIWFDTYGRYTVAINPGGLMTWPREFDSVLSYSIDSAPGALRNQWFEFLESGIGLRDGDTGYILDLVDRGIVPTQVDISGESGKRLLVELDGAETGTIVVKGKDSSGLALLGTGDINLAATDPAYTGLAVTVTLPDGTTTNIASTSGIVSPVDITEVTAIIKPATTGRVRLYELDKIALTARLLSVYEPSETVPSYRRSLVSGYGTPDTALTATVIAKRAHIPVSVDTDFLVIGNLPALEEMCMSLKHVDTRELDRAELYEQRAIRELDRELQHYESPGTKIPLRVESEGWGAGDLDDIR